MPEPHVTYYVRIADNGGTVKINMSLVVLVLLVGTITRQLLYNHNDCSGGYRW